jgi:hypothetical protein
MIAGIRDGLGEDFRLLEWQYPLMRVPDGHRQLEAPDQQHATDDGATRVGGHVLDLASFLAQVHLVLAQLHRVSRRIDQQLALCITDDLLLQRGSMSGGGGSS